MQQTEKLKELAQLFLKLGIIGFGGPAAHVGLMQEEVVAKRGWMTDDEFLDILGATNLIPGPNSTETAIHIGYRYAGVQGLIVAGACFIVPAVLMTLGLAALYVRYGQLPEVLPILKGIQLAVLGIILNALWKLGQKAVKGVDLAVVGLGVAAAVFVFQLNEIVALFAGGLAGMLWRTRLRWGNRSASIGFLAIKELVFDQTSNGWQKAAVAFGSLSSGLALAASAGPAAWQLGLFFLMIGSILYGSGYVLIAFIDGWLVDEFQWLTSQQLLDAIAAGQLTPGPVSSTAAFVGFLLAGVPGAMAAAGGIFTPSFIFVRLLSPWVPRMRDSPWTSAFLDAVNVCAVGLILAVLLQLVMATVTSPIAAVLAVVAAVMLLVFKVDALWLIPYGAISGWLLLG